MLKKIYYYLLSEYSIIFIIIEVNTFYHFYIKSIDIVIIMYIIRIVSINNKQKTMKKTATISLKVSEQLKEAIEREAQAQNRSKNNLLEILLTKTYLKKD